MTASIEENYGKPLECHPSIEENGSSLQALLPAIQKKHGNFRTSERLTQKAISQCHQHQSVNEGSWCQGVKLMSPTCIPQ